MKLDRKVFLAQLEALKPAIAGGSSIAVPELKNIWFDGEYARAYDGGLGIRIKCDTGLKLGVSGTALMGVIADKSHDEISLEQKQALLEVRYGKVCANLATISLDSSPWGFPEGPAADSLMVKVTEELLTGLKRAGLARSSQPTRVEHYGVVLFVDGGTLLLYSTNTHSLVECPVVLKASVKLDRTVLPFAFVEVVLRECVVGDCIYVSPKCLLALGENIVVGSNVLDTSGVVDLPEMVGKFVKGKEVFSVIPEGLSSSLDRVDALAGNADAYIKLSVKDKQLSLSGKYQYGSLQETLLLDKAQADLAVEIDAKLLRKGLGEASKFALTEKAIIMQGAEEFLYLLVARE